MKRLVGIMLMLFSTIMVVTDVNAQSQADRMKWYRETYSLKGLPELKKHYSFIQRAVNNPNLIWFPQFQWGRADDKPHKFMSRKQFEQYVMQELISRGDYSIENHVAAVLRGVRYSNYTKEEVRKHVLPTLNKQIRPLEKKQADKRQAEQSEKEKLDAVLRRINKRASAPVKMETGH